MQHAKKKSHMHWDHLYPFIATHPQIKFILIHFSKKYTWPEIKIFFDKINKTTPIDNVVIWLHTSPVDYSKVNQKIKSDDNNIVEI